MHLYFARFFSHFLHGEGMLGQREPFISLLTQGMVMGQSYRVKGTGRYLTPDQVDHSGRSEINESTIGWMDVPILFPFREKIDIREKLDQRVVVL